MKHLNLSWCRAWTLSRYGTWNAGPTLFLVGLDVRVFHVQPILIVSVFTLFVEDPYTLWTLWCGQPLPDSPSFCFLSKMTVNLLYLWCSQPLPNSSQGIIPDSSGSLRLQTSARVQARKKAICLQRSIASNRAANNLYRFALNFSNVRWLFSTRHY